jgi:hypothetical protein
MKVLKMDPGTEKQYAWDNNNVTKDAKMQPSAAVVPIFRDDFNIYILPLEILDWKLMPDQDRAIYKQLGTIDIPDPK